METLLSTALAVMFIISSRSGKAQNQEDKVTRIENR